MSKLKPVLFASLLLCMVLGFAKSSFAATYYVANAGNDACNGTSSTIGTSEDCAWQTIAHVNAQSFLSGDSILFNRGDTWYESLTIQSSGSSGNPITFGAYGSGNLPVLSGGTVMNGFVYDSQNVYRKTGVTIQPYICITNGQVGNLKPSKDAITNPGDWYWASGTLSVYATSDPSGNVVVGQRGPVINLNGKSFITINNLFITASNNWSGYGGAILDKMYGVNNPSHIIIQNSTITQNAGVGIRLYNTSYDVIDSDLLSYNQRGSGVEFATLTTTPNVSTMNTISNNIMHDNFGNGVGFSGSATKRHTHFSIYGNTSYNNSAGLYPAFMDDSNVYDNNIYNNTKTSSSLGETTNEVYGIGIASCGTTNFYNNIVHDNGNAGIMLYGDVSSLNPGYGPSNGNKLYNNVVYNNNQTGAKVGLSFGGWEGGLNDNEFYDNIVFNNYTNMSAGSAFGERGNGSNSGNKFYNNVLYGALSKGLIIYYDNPGLDVKNNIFAANADVDLYANSVTTGLTTSNNLYYKNTAATLVKYNKASYSSGNISAFEPNALTSDPFFINSSGSYLRSSDFNLQPTSPAINSGVDVGLTSDFAGNAIVGTPDIGAYEYQGTAVSAPSSDTTSPAAPTGLSVQ